MKLLTVLGFVVLALQSSASAQDALARARQAEVNGDGKAALGILEEAAKQSPSDAPILQAWAQALDQRRDPRTREAYQKLLAVAGSDPQRAGSAARRIIMLDLLAGDRQAASQHLEKYRALLPSGWTLPDADKAAPGGYAEIPGPLRSFSRMAALSPDLAPEDVLGAISRNVVTNGYQASSGTESLEQTEYLKLVLRYLSMARELEKLSGEAKTIRVESCDSAQTGVLLKTLGFRMRGGCGSEVVLETVNATRAFLTMDSGFPLAELEEALRTNRPFVMDYRPARLPVLYGPEYWLAARDKQSSDLVDALLNDPSLCRLYLGMSKIDAETADSLRRTLTPQRIRAFAHVFDFFGGMFRIRDGKAVVPGGARAAAGWTDLAGVSPDQGAAFYEAIVTRDDGWLASYFDALSRQQGPLVDYLSEPARLKRYYSALRGRVTSPGPARPVFRANTDLMLLTSRLRVGPDGKPVVPGGLEVWKNLFIINPNGKYDGKLTKNAAGWKDNEDLIEALFGLSRKAVENEPLKIFLSLSDMERGRTKPLAPATVQRLMKDYRNYSSQYLIFAEAPITSDATIIQFLDAATAISDMSDNGQRADAAGMMQSLAGLWQVFYRHKLIPAAEADGVLSNVIAPFLKPKTQREIFDAGRNGVAALLRATGTRDDANPQGRMLELLAGTKNTQDAEILNAIVTEMARTFDAQKLVSLKTLFDFADHLQAASKGEPVNNALLNRLATRLSDLNLPKGSLSAQERNSLSFGYWTEKHIEFERKLNLRASVDKAGGAPEKLAEIRAQLSPILRDTLVGLLYVHYAPPGAQLLQTNSLFVRSHDFSGIQGNRQTWRATEVLGSGWPSSAGGRLVGSLSLLPYALAEAEQNFLIPTREQALIWGDLVPQLLATSKVVRWWNVTPDQLQYVNLTMKAGEALLGEAMFRPEVQNRVIDMLSRDAEPARSRRVYDLLSRHDLAEAVRNVTPAELFHLGQFAVQQNMDVPGGLTVKVQALTKAAPGRFTAEALSDAFGTPKPTLANSLKPQLLNLRLFPTLMGYSSRLMAETWESSNLYYAALADEMHLRPSQLNLLVPEWTQQGVEQIFATHLEDWPALLQSIRVTGDRIRTAQGKSGINAIAAGQD